MAKNIEKSAQNVPTKLSRHMWPVGFEYLHDKPKQIWIRGQPFWVPGPEAEGPEYKFICLIGSRQGTKYGYDVCKALVAGLYGRPCAIVSGLAIGIDGEAHRSALAMNIPCVAIPGSGLNDQNIYPRENYDLAHSILNQGGALISEIEPELGATKWTFPKRNRLMAAMSDLIVVVEAGERSGTYITALQALELGKTLGAVPGPIDSPMSKGANRLIKEGAFPITSSRDILELVGLPSD